MRDPASAGSFCFPSTFGSGVLQDAGMKILIAASEMTPVSNSGGLADFVEGLSSHLGAAGHEVTVVLPFFRCIRENKALGAKRSKTRFSVPVGAENLSCEVWEAAEPRESNCASSSARSISTAPASMESMDAITRTTRRGSFSFPNA